MRAPTRTHMRRLMAEGLRQAGIPGADLDARLLLGFALGVDPAALLSDEPVSLVEAGRAEDLLARRIAGEPVARILGQKEFWSLPFGLSKETLVPRPDTETVVEEALSLIPDRSVALRVLDLGTGSGAILAALLQELPNATGIGVDRSMGAALTARDNLARLGFASRGQVLAGDWAEALAGPFDLVVSNPPYIPSADIAGLDVEVRGHDPKTALDGGREGLDAYATIAAALPRLLVPGGACVLELGVGQEAAVAHLLRDAGLNVSRPARRDLGGIARALAAWRR